MFNDDQRRIDAVMLDDFHEAVEKAVPGKLDRRDVDVDTDGGERTVAAIRQFAADLFDDIQSQLVNEALFLCLCVIKK